MKLSILKTQAGVWIDEYILYIVHLIWSEQGGHFVEILINFNPSMDT